MKFQEGDVVKIVDVIERHSDDPLIQEAIDEEIKRIGMIGKIVEFFDASEPGEPDMYPYCVDLDGLHEDNFNNWHNEAELELFSQE